MNAAQIWQAALVELESVVSKQYFNLWVRSAAPLDHADGVLTIGAPSTFAKEYLEQKCLSQIEKSVGRVIGQPTVVEIVVVPHRGEEPATRPIGRANGSRRVVVGGRAPAPPGATSATADADDDDWFTDHAGAADDASSRSVNAAGPVVQLPEGFALNPRYTFDTFIVGNSNRLAHAASMAVADRPAQAYNPLFIYGGVGLGKTHLLHAIGQQAARANLKVLYLSSERFTNDLINAIRSGRTEEFRNRYRTIDMLLIDDIQFIAGKETTQEEFFHTFNALHEASRQIVLCSDRPPKQMTTLEDRLRSRFEMGLTADVTLPDFEHRVAILQAKAETTAVRVPKDVLEYIARKVQSNIRELEGSLNRVVALTDLTRQPITLETAAAALGDSLDNPSQRFLTGPQIVDTVGKYYRVEARVLRGKQRDRDIVMPRQVAMHIMRQETTMSLVEIGRELGGRDHSTVLHGCDKIAGELQSDQRLRREINDIRQLLYDTAKP